MVKGRFLALPPREPAASLLLLVLAFLLTFLVLYGAGSAWSAYVPWRITVALPIDAAWPFHPEAALIYLTITPVLALAPLVLRDLESLLPLFAALMLETLLAAPCFLLLPVDPPRIDCCAPGVIGTLFHVADALNLERNYLPSLHVAFAFTAAAAYAPRAPRVGGVLLYLWASAVAMSTLLTRQHYLLDVIAGIALAALAWRLGGRWARRPQVRAAVDVELLCLRNYGRFIARHRRYLTVTLAVLAAGIPHWRRQRLVRTGFAFLQAVDDVLDGDRASARDPLQVADELIVGFEIGQFGSDQLGRLGAAFRHDLRARAGDAGLATALALLRRMRLDRERMLSARVSDEEELAGLHRDTFRGSLDLMLIAADSPLRARDVPELVEALGWCSAVRDLGEDLAHGLVNLPRTVANAAQKESGSSSPAAWIGSHTVRDWLQAERARGHGLLQQADARLATLDGQRGAALLRRFARSMRRHASS